MTHRLRIDLETYSSVDLPKTGVYRYAESDDFLILMAAWSLDGGPVQVAFSREEIHAIPGLWDDTTIKVAQNAQFERICLSKFANLPVGTYLDPELWHDTQAVAATYGYPQRLVHLAPALGDEQKDEAGTRLINIFSKPNRKGQRTLPEEKPADWLDFVDYCEQDVVSLIDIDEKLEAMGSWPTEMERQIFLADQRINDLGITVDVRMARKAMAADESNTNRNKFELVDATSWQVENPNSQPQMMNWIRSEGLDAKNLQAATVTRLLEGDLTETQRTVLELRQQLALVASKKYAAALRSVSPDDRLRGTLKYFGAHTGRWAGRGTQVHNLPREQVPLRPEDLDELEMMEDLGMDPKVIAAREGVLRDEETARIISSLKRGRGAESITLKALVRALFVGPFTVVDYAAIEARVIAWLAGEMWALEAFALGRDIYVETAERMSTANRPLTRSQGKVAVLALGFQGAINSLRVMGAEGSDADLDAMVGQWRRANPKIVDLWGTMGNAFADGGPVGKHMHVTRSEDKLGQVAYVRLPSGRSIGYHDVRWERYKVPHPIIPNKWISKTGWRYADPRDPFNPNMRIGTYGGRLCENVTQGLARDIMAEGIVRLHERGYDVVAHTHDEIIVEGEHSVDTIARIICENPKWAKGLPLDAEGGVVQRYRKI